MPLYFTLFVVHCKWLLDAQVVLEYNTPQTRPVGINATFYLLFSLLLSQNCAFEENWECAVKKKKSKPHIECQSISL